MILPMTREQFELKRKFLAENGVNLIGDEGSVGAKACTFHFCFLNEQLTVDVVHAPFGMKSIAESKLKAWLAN